MWHTLLAFKISDYSWDLSRHAFCIILEKSVPKTQELFQIKLTVCSQKWDQEQGRERGLHLVALLWLMLKREGRWGCLSCLEQTPRTRKVFSEGKPLTFHVLHGGHNAELWPCSWDQFNNSGACHYAASIQQMFCLQTALLFNIALKIK